MSNQNSSFDGIKKLIGDLGKSGVDVGNVAMSAIGSVGGVATSAIGSVGGVVSSAVSSVGTVASSAVNMIDHNLQKLQEIKLAELQNQMKQMDQLHQEKMLTIQNEHDEKMTQERNRHEEAMCKQQCELIKFAIEAASAAYEKKIDFYKAQLDCLEKIYSKERELLSEHIKFLENERRQYIGDMDKYVLISSDIGNLEKQKNELYSAYLKSQGNLEDCIKYLEIDKSFNSSNLKNDLIGRA